MAEQQKKDNRGYLYPNVNKIKPTQPDHIGKVVSEGKEWNIAAWENTASDGKKYLSLSLTVPLPNTNNSNTTHTNTNHNNKNESSNSSSPSQNSINQDLDDLEDILNSAGDDNPFEV